MLTRACGSSWVRSHAKHTRYAGGVVAGPVQLSTGSVLCVPKHNRAGRQVYHICVRSWISTCSLFGMVWLRVIFVGQSVQYGVWCTRAWHHDPIPAVCLCTSVCLTGAFCNPRSVYPSLWPALCLRVRAVRVSWGSSAARKVRARDCSGRRVPGMFRYTQPDALHVRYTCVTRVLHVCGNQRAR